MNKQLEILSIVSAISFILTPYSNSSKKSKLITVIICTVIMGFFLGLRTWWMADIVKYHTQFVNIGSYTLKELLQERIANIGLRYYFHLIYTYFNMNFQIALIGIAGFQMFCLGYVVYHYSPSVFWSFFTYIFLGFYFFLFSGLKQGIAMAFLLIAYSGIIDNKPVKFLLFTILGGLFHAPAFIFLIAYPWANAKLGKYYFGFLILLFVVVLTFRTQIVTALADMYYEEAEYISTGGVGGKFLAMMVIIVLSILVRPVAEEDKIYYKTFNLMVLAALLQSFSIFGNNFTRLADYYFQFSTIFIPLIMQYRADDEIPEQAIPIIRFTERSYIIAGVVLFILGFVFYSRYISGDIAGIKNLKFFWEVSQSPWGS